jgi:hypothetical protein
VIGFTLDERLADFNPRAIPGTCSPHARLVGVDAPAEGGEEHLEVVPLGHPGEEGARLLRERYRVAARRMPPPQADAPDTSREGDR